MKNIVSIVELKLLTQIASVKTTLDWAWLLESPNTIPNVMEARWLTSY